jgi:hypothetical protein
MYGIFEWQPMQSSKDLYEREKARPERVDFWTSGGWSHVFEVVFQCSFVGILEEDIMGPVVGEAAIKADDTRK